VEALAARHGGTFRREPKHQAELARARIAGQEIWLAKPLNYMNRSGGPTASIAGFYKIAPAEMLVAHDDLDIPVGDVRLKQGGGHGGQNGLRDIIATLGDAFWRVRIGIGHPGNRDQVIDYVLHRPSASDETAIQGAIARAADAVEIMVSQGAQRAMQGLHGKPQSADIKPQS
jgi:PTH1 family peptidyl-tRNA hydrolase